MIACDYGPDEKWNDYGLKSPVISFFNNIHPINSEVEAYINQETFPIKFKKNKFIISPLDRDKNFYLVLKGVARGFVKLAGVDITTWIVAEGEIIGTMDNFMAESDSIEYVEALEGVELVAMPHDFVNYLYDNHPEFNIIGRKIMEAYYCDAEERAFLIRLPTAEMKYKRFLTSYPGLINRISLKYIASFLGLRLETLSRVRARG